MLKCQNFEGLDVLKMVKFIYMIVPNLEYVSEIRDL